MIRTSGAKSSRELPCVTSWVQPVERHASIPGCRGGQRTDVTHTVSEQLRHERISVSTEHTFKLETCDLMLDRDPRVLKEEEPCGMVLGSPSGILKGMQERILMRKGSRCMSMITA